MDTITKYWEIDIENDERPPSVLKILIKNPIDEPPFCDVPNLPESFGTNNLKLADWLKAADALYSIDKLRYTVLMYAFSNGGTFTMEMVPKSFRYKDLPSELEEEEWIKSFQYVSKVLNLEQCYMTHDQIKEAADKLTSMDDEGRGPFFKKSETNKYTFLSDLIADAVAHSYCGRRKERALHLAQPVFLYRYCMTYVQYRNVDDYFEKRLVVFVSDNQEETVFEKFVKEICKGNINDTLGNRMFEDESFCSRFFKYLKRSEVENVEKKMFTTIDVKSTAQRPKSFLYCLVAQDPPKNFLLAPSLDLMKTHCEHDFIDLQFCITLEYCCRKGLIDIYLKLAPNIKTFPFAFIRSAILSGDSILLDRVLSHQTWTQKQVDKAMQWIAMTGKFDDYLRIKHAGARPDSLTLYESAIGRNIQIFEDILRDGVDCNASVYQGRKTIHAAAESGSKDIVDMLIQRGACVESRSELGELPLHIAIDNYHEDLAENLLMRGADPNLRDFRGATALIRACAKGLYRLVERLMYVGADVSDVDDQGCNILHKAYLSGEIEIIQFANSNGLSVKSLDKNNNSVLHFSALSGNLKQFEGLLNQMPSMISACNTFMWNPATCAAICGRRDIFLFLKQNGTDLQQKTKDGRSILELAVKGKQLLQLKKHAFIEEFQETVRLGSIEEYDDIIKSL